MPIAQKEIVSDTVFPSYSCLLYTSQAKWIILYYQGKNLTEKAILEQAKAKLPNYMWPNKFIPIKRMPYNANGKIDRKALKAMYAGG